jgi:hypothetical protein
MPEQAAMAWIEDGTGRIARGHVDSASAEGGCVRLPERPAFGEGDEVAVRICFEVGSPTVAATARVSGIRASGDGFLCDLQWAATSDSEFNSWPADAA